MTQGLSVGLSNKRSQVRILCYVAKILGKFIHSTLLKFTQLGEYLAIVVDMVDMFTSSLRALIVAYGWMLPREGQTVLD